MNHESQLLVYRQAVNKILTFHHLDIENGLRQADEQEAFIYSVWRRLLRLGWQVSLTMDNRFNVIFYLRCYTLPIDEQKKHVYAELNDVAEVTEDSKRLYASSFGREYLSCSIAFYDSIPEC